MSGKGPFGDPAASADLMLGGAEVRRSWEGSAWSSRACHPLPVECEHGEHKVHLVFPLCPLFSSLLKNSECASWCEMKLGRAARLWMGLSVTLCMHCHKRPVCTILAIFLKQLHKKSHNIWKVKYESNFLQHTARGTEICKEQARMKLQWQQLPRPGGVWRQGCMTSVLL